MQDMIEILTNFMVITAHFGVSVLDKVSNTNFMVYLTNAYCLARKINKHWAPVFKDDKLELCINHV